MRQPFAGVRLLEAASAMAEARLLAFARTALEVGRAVLPSYRTRFSKRQFAQPQLLAILGLMRYEDWIFREAEVRLREHSELRQALSPSSVHILAHDLCTATSAHTLRGVGGGL